MNAVAGRRVVREIGTKRGKFKAKFLALDTERVLVLVKRHTKEPAFVNGTVFVRNRELKARTGDRIEYMAYEHGLYEAHRAGCHIDRQSGQLPNVKNGELQEIYDDIRTAREYVMAMLSAGALTEDDTAAFKDALLHLTRLLGSKRNPWKLGAESNFVRALRQKDTLGRVNLPAAAMAGGGGIGKLMKREVEVRSILGVVNGRTLRVFRAIQHTMSVYGELRGHLGRKGLLRLMAGPNAGPGAMKRTLDVLNDEARRFERIHEKPFGLNARLTAEDLRQAARTAFKIASFERKLKSVSRPGTEVRLASEIDVFRKDLVSLYDRIQQGIAWVFAQHALEMELISPLAFLLESLRRTHRSKHRANGSSARTRLVYTRALAPAAFSAIEESVRIYRSKVAGMNESLLRHPVKQALLRALDEAIKAVEDNNWLLVKRRLKEASDQI